MNSTDRSNCSARSSTHDKSLTQFLSNQFRPEEFAESILGLSQDQIASIDHGQPFAKNMQPRSPAEIFVVGVIYINAAPNLDEQVNQLVRKLALSRLRCRFLQTRNSLEALEVWPRPYS